MNNDLLKDATILVVDDEEFMRDLIAKLLTDLGVGVIYRAAGVGEAIELLATHREEIDCIVSDFKMPEQTGIEFLQTVRAGRSPAPRDMPFAMLTAHADKFVLGLAMALGVDAFIAKPVSKDTLGKRLNSVLAQERPELPPASIYQGVSLGTPVSDLEARVETLEGIIRQLAKSGLPAGTEFNLPEPETEDIKRSPVWTTMPTLPTNKPPANTEAVAGTNPEAEHQTDRPVSPELLPCVAVKLSDVPEDAMLARDLRSKDGRLILSAGSRLTDGVLDKIDHIVDMGEEVDLINIVA